MRAFSVGLSRAACLSDNYLMPVPNWETVGTNLQFYSSVNVTQYFGESIHGAGHIAEMNELRAWVQASMMWDATRDPASLVSEFVLHFYGARAAPHVMAHMDAWGRGLQSVTNWTDALSHGGFTACGADALIHPGNCYDQPWVTMQPVVESAIALRAALDALDPAFESDAIFAHRVEKVLISSWWIILMRWDEACSYATQHQLEWPLAESMAASLQGWEAATARQGIVKLCDGIPGFTAASYNDTKTAGKFCPPRTLKKTRLKTDDGTKSKSTGFVAFTATGTCVCRADHSKNKWCNYSDANGLIDPDNFDCRNYRNLVEMAQVSVEAFGDEWNRTVPCALHGDAADPSHDLCDFHGSWPTSGLLKQAKGRRVLWLDFAAAARNQPGSISAHPKDAVVLANASACPEEGSLFTGIWWDHGAAAVAAQAEAFFSKLRAAGGSVDQMVLDFEAGMLTPDACAAPYAGGVPGVPKTPANQRSAQACRACAAEKWRAIQNDARFALDLPKLKAMGLMVDETQHDYLVDAMMRWQCNGGQWPHAMTACVNDQTNDTNRKVWNSCERSTHCAFSISARNCCSLANAQSFAFRHSPASV